MPARPAAPRASDGRPRTGRSGESLAAAFLRLKGYRIEARNWRCALGELDLVCLDGEILVFVEVKTRRGGGAGRPEEAVDARKQARLIRLAQAYLAARPGEAPACRFDVVAVDARRLVPHVRHYRAAFRADGLAG